MDVTEARVALRHLVEHYFQKATVTYAKQSFAVKKKGTLVKLTFGTITRPLNPPTTIIDGCPAAFYPTAMMVQIDLFTHGRQIDIAPGVTPVMENTAAEDLLAFVNFLNSEYAVSYCHIRDLAIVIPNNVLDVTDLINDTNYEYRAMVEVELRFTTVALGYTGTLSLDSVKQETSAHELVDFNWTLNEIGPNTKVVPSVVQSSSGGGNIEDASEESDYFENVSINNKLVKED